MTVQQIVYFLHDLFQQGKLKVNSLIEGYKSAIVATLIKASGVNVGTDSHICRLIGSFYTDRPVGPDMVPRWDLIVVLDAFTKSPFKPHNMASLELKFLTFKMVFLLSLGSGVR